MSIYYSTYHKGKTIDMAHLVLALEDQNTAPYSIKLVMVGSRKYFWEYYDKDVRDKELSEIRALQKEYRDQNKKP